MGNEKSTVITVYGHDQVIDKIAVSLFDKSKSDYHDYDESNAKTYCATINSLKLEGDSWVFARIVSENTQYPAKAFFPRKFDMLLTLDDRVIQEVLREVDTTYLVKALKGESEALREKIFKNMSKRAVQLIKEDMECMGPVRTIEVKEAQDRILEIIRRLEQSGEIFAYTGELII
jgi:hypothetical protein